MKAAYTEIAFWLTTVAGILGMITEALTGYPGELVPDDYLFIAGIVGSVLSLLAAAALKRVQA